MEAAEAKVQKVLRGDQQFLVPHFQRPYSWREREWRVLWEDLLELLGEDDPEPHFLGSIVTAPARTVPEGCGETPPHRRATAADHHRPAPRDHPSARDRREEHQ